MKVEVIRIAYNKFAIFQSYTSFLASLDSLSQLKKWSAAARATSGSAGYDFCTPVGFSLAPGETIKIPTGIRVKIEEGWMLGLYPRSGLGFKYRMQLNNTVGIIDSDYYYSDNEGHIMVKFTNASNTGLTINLNAGDAFSQGIFTEYGITFDDDATGVRNGGFGSTGR